jgi:hypothetical protein
MTTIFTLTGGALPGGLSLNPNGSMTGVPTSATGGNYSITVTATNSAGQTSAQFILPYLTLPKWTTAAGTLTSWYPSNPAGGAVQSIGVLAVSTSGNPVSYSLVSGALPPGCSLDPASGTISGLVGWPGGTANVAFNFTIAAQDSGFTNSVARAFSIVILAVPAPHEVSATWTGPANENFLGGLQTAWAGFDVAWVLTAAMTSNAILSSYPITLAIDPAHPLINGLSFSDNGNGSGVTTGTIDPAITTGTYTTRYLLANPFTTGTYAVAVGVYQATAPVWGPFYSSDLIPTAQSDDRFLRGNG